MTKAQTKHSAQTAQARTKHSAQMAQNTSDKYRELEKRTLDFAKDVIALCKKCRTDNVDMEIVRQLVRASGSIGANYREANEALGKKDLTYRIRISRKEAKETSYWLDILASSRPDIETECKKLQEEVKELRNIFSAILSKMS
jgi:four helix bundle protein